VIFHITTEPEWSAAKTAGRYEADSLAADGFIHCSTEGQVARVANAAFRGRTDLLVLHIDESRLAAAVKYENTEGGEELFPHAYGPIEVGAVTEVSPLQAAPEGHFQFP
jgi:uncharacterized protein (DUF952 family)